MLETIKAGYDGLKATTGIVQGIFALKSETEKNQAIIDIQRNVLEAQRALTEADGVHAADLKRIAELEQEIVRLKDWSAERKRYQLVDVWQGAFAYMPKPGMEDGQPAHWLCTNCFNQGRRSFMQSKGGVDGDQFGCDACKGSFRVAKRVRPSYPNSDASA